MGIVLGGKKGGIIGSLITIVVGLGLVVGVYLYNRAVDKKTDGWQHTTARVVRYDERRESDDDGYDYKYREIVEYEVNGVTYVKPSNVWSSVRPSIGAYREIAYNSDNPEDCVFVSGRSVLIVILYAVGGLFAAVGAFAFVYTLVKYRNK